MAPGSDSLLCVCVHLFVCVRVCVCGYCVVCIPAVSAALASAENDKTGRLLASISSRPGQCGRSDGYILEGEELAFYKRKLRAK